MIHPPDMPETVHVPNHIGWVQDEAGLLLVNETTQASERLMGLAAALWDWLGLGYDYKKLVEFAAAWLALPADQVEPVVRQQLHIWWKQEFLVDADGDR